MIKDEQSNLRIFAVNISRIGNVKHESFTLYARDTIVTITVDWTQKGKGNSICQIKLAEWETSVR